MKAIEEKDILLDSFKKKIDKWKRLCEDEKERNETLTLKNKALQNEIEVKH